MKHRRAFIKKTFVLLAGLSSLKYFSSCKQELLEPPVLLEKQDILPSLKKEFIEEDDFLLSLKKGFKIFISTKIPSKEIIVNKNFDQIRNNRVDLIELKKWDSNIVEQTDNIVLGSLILLDKVSMNLLKLENVSLIQEGVLFFKYNKPKLLKINKYFKNTIKILDEKCLQQ